MAAFAKVNLCLFLGAPREDGRHQLVTVFESVTLADELVITPLLSGVDGVVCPAVSGPNLVADALAGLRAAGWNAPPLRVEIEKRIPVAAGMGGGSADAAAMLRFAPRLAPVPAAELAEIAIDLGADVPSQLDPGPSLGIGAGEIVKPVAELADHAVLMLPQAFELSTAEVYQEADRLGLARSPEDLALRLAELETAVGHREPGPVVLPERLLVNDLEPAALSLRPEIGAALEAAREAGAAPTLVCGSGPTVIGLFWADDADARAAAAVAALRSRFPRADVTRPVRRGVSAPAAKS